MSRFTELFRRTPETKNELSPDETAKQLRELQLDMMNYGVIGSTTEIPHEENKKAISLPHLLGYSSHVLKHFDILRGILHTPKKFGVAKNTPAFEHIVWGDVLYQEDGGNHVYTFGTQVVSPFINPWIATGENKPDLNVTILQDNKRMQGAWHIGYTFSVDDPTSPDNIGNSIVHAEKNTVLNFLYAPKQLSGKYIYDHRGGNEHSKDYITYLGEESRGGFRRFNFKFDALQLATNLNIKIWRNKFHHGEVDALRKKGESEFSVVEIGTVSLGGQKHWVYTGSEQTQIGAKQKRRSMSGVFKPKFASGYS